MKTGYDKDFAAVEGGVTGVRSCRPSWGAAFLMAEMTGVPYSKIVCRHFRRPLFCGNLSDGAFEVEENGPHGGLLEAIPSFFGCSLTSVICSTHCGVDLLMSLFTRHRAACLAIWRRLLLVCSARIRV